MSTYAMSEQGREWLALLEGGHRLKAYQDSKGLWTIGAGVTWYGPGRPVREGDKLIGTHDAKALFVRTLAKHERALVAMLERHDLEQHQFDALASWYYNTGGGPHTGLIHAVNARASAHAIAEQFRRWCKATASGQPAIVVPGLVARREAEILAYTRGLYVDQAEAMRRRAAAARKAEGL